MKVMITTLIFIIAIVMALSITRTTKQDLRRSSQEKTQESPIKPRPPSKRLSRFLAETKPRNPRAADHCNKDNEICNNYLIEGRNSTCCNNKCMDLGYDNHNCGACKKKCLVTESCCRGQCVNLSYDKRHCGFCNNRCMPGGICIYGICDYA
ncbi:hypothetical protein M9H77_15142 [Catharanthus roseus]|uniref:Uncharacterized protein n=1 Tax=Catharanthus roseus TaxID=4058 RepID=A0ACC0BQ82_CATRO|nr:hypothetical protein M9H77_15142 [Catharanthus roseus]